MAFGVVRQAITYPNNDFDWDLVKEIFHKPYFMLYGEVYAPEIDRKWHNCFESLVVKRWGNIVVKCKYLDCLLSIFNKIYTFELRYTGIFVWQVVGNLSVSVSRQDKNKEKFGKSRSTEKLCRSL